jgi:DNA-binding transcriptional regulator GbsR (MarR family)
MLYYNEVPASSIMAVSAVPESFSVDPFEKFFANHFFSKGQNYYNTFKSASVKSNTTFIKDLFNNLKDGIYEDNLTDQQRVVLTLLITSMVNQIKVLEEMFKELDNEKLNAIICGTFFRYLKKYFS